MDNVIARGFEANPSADKDTIRNDYFRPYLDDTGFVFVKGDGTSEIVDAATAEG